MFNQVHLQQRQTTDRLLALLAHATLKISLLLLIMTVGTGDLLPLRLVGEADV